MLTGGDKSVSREFSRQVDIPPNIDPQSLRSTLSNDGILQVILYCRVVQKSRPLLNTL